MTEDHRTFAGLWRATKGNPGMRTRLVFLLAVATLPVGAAVTIILIKGLS